MTACGMASRSLPDRHPRDAVADENEDITVDRYSVEGMLPWQDDEPDEDNEDGVVIWLVGGEDDDVDAFLDAIEHPDD